MSTEMDAELDRNAELFKTGEESRRQEEVRLTEVDEHRHLDTSMRKHLSKYIVDRGLFPEQADEIIDACAKEHHSFAGALAKSAEDYAKPIVISSQILVSAYAVKWIDANAPEHWARALFAL